MTRDQQIEFLERTHKEAIALLKRKGSDYSSEDNVLKNFDQMYEMMKILEVDTSKKESVYIFYILIKLQRLCNLIFNSKTPANESLMDTLQDFENYIKLLRCNFKEQEPEKNESSDLADTYTSIIEFFAKNNSAEINDQAICNAFNNNNFSEKTLNFLKRVLTPLPQVYAHFLNKEISEEEMSNIFAEAQEFITLILIPYTNDSQ